MSGSGDVIAGQPEGTRSREAARPLDDALTRGPSAPGEDDVDAIIAGWRRERPDWDVAPVGVVSRIARLAARFTQAIEANLAGHGMTKADFEALAALRRAGEPYRLSQGDLMRVLSLTPGTVSVRVDRLAAQGWVARGPDPADGRGVTVTLTGPGRAAFEAAVPDHLATEHGLLAALESGERERLAALLRRLLLAQSRAATPGGSRTGKDRS